MLSRYKNPQGVEYVIDFPNVYEIVKLDDLLLCGSENLVITNAYEEKFKLDFEGTLLDFQKLPLFTSFEKLKLKYRDFAAYLIVCYKEDRFYIGSSSNVAKRLDGHRNRLTSGKNVNRNMLEVFQRHSPQDFQVIVLACSSKEQAFDMEQALMDRFKNDPRKLNISDNARDSSKFIPSAEAKARRKAIMSEKMKRVHADPAYKANHRQKLAAFYQDAAAREKHAAAIKARFEDPAFRQGYDAQMRTKVWSNPAAISARKVGFAKFNADPEAKKKRLEKASIIFNSPEYRKKASQTATLRLADPALRQAHSEKLKLHYANDDKRARAFEANKHLAKPVNIEGVVYKSVHEASKNFNMSRPGVKFRIESSSPAFEAWTYA